VIFAGHDPDHGIEPWATDGTPEGTALLADLEPGPASSAPGPFARFGDRVAFAATTSAEGRELWSVAGSGAPEIVADLFPGPASSAPEIVGVFGDHLFFLGDDGIVGYELWSLDGAERVPCAPSQRELCLNGGRFRVSATWREFTGRLGEATAASLTADSGYFWFFDPANPELLVKVLDACGTEAHNYWVFTTGLTDVEVTLDVQDSWSGVTKRIETGLAEPFLPTFDSGSFHVCDAAAVEPTRVAAQAASLGPTLPLLGGRFEAEASWRYPGASGVGEAVALSDQAGYFWFFHPDNVELLVKVLDGCPLQPYPAYWVFAGGLTDLEVVLSVRDLFTGRVYSVATPGGIPFPPVLDAGALATCP
jgi:ELWxxDGT repeat protein